MNGGFSIGVEVYPSGVYTFRRYPGRPLNGAGMRSDVYEFSSNSRRRFRRAMLQFDWPDIITNKRALWATLTAREGTTPEFKRWLDIWRRRLVREWPEAWMVWRLEYQKRGRSHFHAIPVLPTTRAARDAMKVLVPAWCEIAGESNALLVSQSIKPVDSLAGIASYISDASKVSQATPPASEHPGRWWGIRGHVPEDDNATPEVVKGREAFYDTKRLVRGLRVGRRRTMKNARRKRRKVRPMKDSVEFFDTRKLAR